MFSLNDLMFDYGFSPDDIVSAIDCMFSSDDVCYVIYNMLQENDMDIPSEIEDYYNLHCR